MNSTITTRFPLRILLLAGNLGRVGDAMRAVATGKALARRGNDVTVLYPKSDRSLGFRQYVENGVRIVESPRWHNVHPYSPFQNPWNIFANVWWLANHFYDVYHGFVPVENVGIPWLVFSRLKPDAIYVYDQSDLIVDGGFLGDLDGNRGLARISYKISAWTELTLKRKADAHFVMSKALEQRALEQGVQPEHIHLIRTGPMINPLHPAVGVQVARERIGLEFSGLVLGFSSIHLAGLKELFAGMAIFALEGYSFQVIFTGTSSDAVKEFIRESRLQENIILTGWLDDEDFLLHMSACDILLAPLEDSLMHRYNFPSKLLNYMAVGRPVVVGDVGDTGEFVRSHEIGLAYQGGPAGLARAITFLASNPDKGRAMGARGCELVAGELSWKVIAAQIEGVYQASLLAKRQKVQEENAGP